MSSSRRLIASLLLLPLASCGYPTPSPKNVEAALMRTGGWFTDPKMIVVPQRIEVHTDESFGGGSLDDRQLNEVDAVVAILHANKLVDLTDVHSSDGEGGYMHILSIAPASDAPADLFVETDEPSKDPSWRDVRKIPGWRVMIARRQFDRVWQIHDAHTAADNEKLSPGYVLAYFDFHWIPTEIGKLFDESGVSFEDLSPELQAARRQLEVPLDSHLKYSGRVWLTRDGKGDWKATLFDCWRCPNRN
jgi:hypothetical protein